MPDKLKKQKTIFRDHFSGSSEYYASSRPNYPEELFEYIISYLKERNTAWDCATGNGQTALSLANYFEKVIATDASEEQIKNAYEHEKISYHISKADENPFIENESIDLVTSSTAVHWLDLDKFYTEVKRVLKRDGVIAVWSYGEFVPENELSRMLNDFAFIDLLDYWPKEARFNWENRYKDLYFPFEEEKFPEIEMSAMWNLDRTIRYISSWSSVKNYIDKHGNDPVEKVKKTIEDIWTDKNKPKQLKWKLFGKTGRIK